MGDTIVSELMDKEKIKPTKEWLETQVKSCQIAIERNIGAMNFCLTMLKNNIYLEEQESHNG